MDPRDLDAKRLELRREWALARYASGTARWQGLQGPVVAALSVALAAWVGGQLRGQVFAILAAFGLFYLVIAARVLSLYDRRLEAELDDLDAAFDRLKRGGRLR